MLQVRNILKLGKAILLWSKIDCFITVSNYNNNDLFLYFYDVIFGKEIYSICIIKEGKSFNFFLLLLYTVKKRKVPGSFKPEGVELPWPLVCKF